MHVNVTEYDKGRRDALESIRQIGGERVSANFDRSLRASESDYARGAREIVWAWRLTQHPCGGARSALLGGHDGRLSARDDEYAVIES